MLANLVKIPTEAKQTTEKIKKIRLCGVASSGMKVTSNFTQIRKKTIKDDKARHQSFLQRESGFRMNRPCTKNDIRIPK